MSGGGKGGTSSNQVKIDPNLERASKDMLDYAAAAASTPYTPNRGNTVAAFTPLQQAAHANANSGAGAFGLSTANANASPIGPATIGENGIAGYNTGAMYDQNKAASFTPALSSSIDRLFADPTTGRAGGAHQSPLYRSIYGGGK